jgi:stringent starvation protein B
MTGSDDGEQNDGEGSDGASEHPNENVVRIDFAARRQRREHQQQQQQRLADAARLRPPAADLGADRPEKLRMFARLIEQGMTMVTLDARQPGVRVPSNLSQELMLNLNFSLRFGIDDFAYDDDGVRASLTFQKMPFFCEIPWAAVYQMTSTVNADRMVWPDSLPAELADRVPPQVRPSTPRPSSPRPSSPRPSSPRPSPPRPGPALTAAPPATPPQTTATATATTTTTTSSTEPAATSPAASPGPGDDVPPPPSPRPTLRRVK